MELRTGEEYTLPTPYSCSEHGPCMVSITWRIGVQALFTVQLHLRDKMRIVLFTKSTKCRQRMYLGSTWPLGCTCNSASWRSGRRRSNVQEPRSIISCHFTLPAPPSNTANSTPLFRHNGFLKSQGQSEQPHALRPQGWRSTGPEW